jgi:hypothetical protein
MFIQAQSSSAMEAKLQFPAEMTGGSKGVPGHLPGTLFVSTDRIEFEAFPQVEDNAWSCKQIERLSSGKERVMLTAGRIEYRFILKSAQQTIAFTEAVHSACSERYEKLSLPEN